MLKFIPVDMNNPLHKNLLESISNSTVYLGDITKYKIHHNPNKIYGNDFIVLFENNPIGYLGVTDKVDTDLGKTVSLYYAIDKKYYGNGFGMKIVNTARDILKSEKEIDYIVANVDNTNTMGIKTIEKCAFVPSSKDSEETQYLSRLRN